tara:strand:- start:455 stop:706 length:252 start_codon:yes stop_codon:yes gene_type:complete
MEVKRKLITFTLVVIISITIGCGGSTDSSECRLNFNSCDTESTGSAGSTDITWGSGEWNGHSWQDDSNGTNKWGTGQWNVNKW